MRSVCVAYADAALARLNQGALLIMMRNYEEGLKCSSAALSRLQEEWATGSVAYA